MSWLRPEWPEIWREWSTRLWVLALALSAVSEQSPALIDRVLVGLPPEAATWVTTGLGLLGLLAKFAPQRALQQRAEKRRQHDRTG